MGNHAQQGFFITLEGGEGSGKTSQINQLAAHLTEQGYKVVTTREPGGTPEAESIRNLLVQRDGGDWNPMAEVLLIFAARIMHIQNIIRPALDEGKIVICDRFTDSTLAYQGYDHGLDIKKIKDIQNITIENFAPDLTFILDIDINTGLDRSKKRLAADKGYEQTEDRFERLDSAFHERLRQGFLDIAAQDTARCHVEDASQSIDVVSNAIKRIALERINDHK